jgi:hypothetical protein
MQEVAGLVLREMSSLAGARPSQFHLDLKSVLRLPYPRVHIWVFSERQTIPLEDGDMSALVSCFLVQSEASLMFCRSH